MQPRVGISLEESKMSVFSEIFAGSGGVDSYTNAISDIYQDNFDEGIYTGKGIYNLKVFCNVMKGKIPDNTVLSHDLLEGCYLRCGLASDIMLLDGYPKSFLAFLKRLHRWIRGDYQILGYLKKNAGLNKLSKFKILDNIRRSLLEFSVILSVVILITLKMFKNVHVLFGICIMLLAIIIPSVLDFLSYIIFKKENIKKQKMYTNSIEGLKGSFYRALINLMILPTKAYVSIDAAFRTIYRMKVSKKRLLEWTTSEEAERQDTNNVYDVYKRMFPNVVLGLIFLFAVIFATCSIFTKVLIYCFSGVCLIAPLIMWYISNENISDKKFEKLTEEEQGYIRKIAEKTWDYFAEYMNKENSYLPPDNFQESRREKIVPRTSSTNIGLRTFKYCICL